MKYWKIPLLSIIGCTSAFSAISCSTSWTSWHPDKNVKKTETNFKHDTLPARSWKLREEEKILEAFDKNTNSIDLTKVNNQYELNFLIGHILNISPNISSIDEFWDVSHFDNMKEYLKKINNKIDISFKLAKVTKLKWDVEDIIKNGIKGLEDYKKNPNPKLKAFDIEGNQGLNSSGLPVKLGEVANIGGSLLSIKAVNALTTVVDPMFALRLSKLVNLPKNTFKAFGDLVTKIDELLNKIYSLGKSKNEAVDEWMQKNKLNLKASNKNGSVNNKWDNSVIKGIFLSKTLKK